MKVSLLSLPLTQLELESGKEEGFRLPLSVLGSSYTFSTA